MESVTSKMHCSSTINTNCMLYSKAIFDWQTVVVYMVVLWDSSSSSSSSTQFLKRGLLFTHNGLSKITISVQRVVEQKK
jgi:hypothetical protein